ncbi:hypothetical protein TKK_0003448 [Trichogramma kaykai]
MYVIVLWTGTNETSVIKETDLKDRKSDYTQAKWEKKWYPVKVVVRDDDKEFLESLSVTTEGEVVGPRKRRTMSPELILKKKENSKKSKGEACMRAQSTSKLESSILKSKKLFADTELDSSSSDDLPTKASPVKKVVDLRKRDEKKSKTINKERDVRSSRPISQNIPPPKKRSMKKIESSSDYSDSEVPAKRKATNSKKVNPKKVSFKKNEPKYSKSNSEHKKKDVQSSCSSTQDSSRKNKPLVSSIGTEISRSSSSKKTPDSESTSKNSSSNDKSMRDDDNVIIELMPKSKVYVNEAEVTRLQLVHQKAPRELTRRLMRLIVTDEVLSRSTATGKSETAIPQNIYWAIFVLTSLCGTLRNPKPKHELTFEEELLKAKKQYEKKIKEIKQKHKKEEEENSKSEEEREN